MLKSCHRLRFLELIHPRQTLYLLHDWVSFSDMTTVTDTTTHTATDLRTTPPTIPDLTTDLRITVGHTTNTLDPTTGVPTTTRAPTRREIGETTITEVALGITRLKVGTTRTAIGTAIRLRATEIRRAHPSLVLRMRVNDTERTSEAWKLIGRRDDSV